MTAELTREEIDRLDDDEVVAYAVWRERQDRITAWRSGARPDQLPPDGSWTTLFLRGGRGSGKSWAGARILGELIQTDPLRDTVGPGQFAIVAPTFGAARDICVEAPESGLLAALGTSRQEVDAGESELVEVYNRSLGEVRLRDGATVTLDGADDGATRLQGRNLRAAWCDEVGLWRQWERAWDESLGYALRQGDTRLVATGTPKADMPARELVRRLLTDPHVFDRRLRTFDNAAHLSSSFLESRAAAIGTRLGRQELEGELIEDVEGALWKRAWIDEHRVQDIDLRNLTTIVIGLDPADGTARGDEQGLAAVGIGVDGYFYVLRSAGTRDSPLEWLSGAVRVGRELTAARLVVEKNHGGMFLTGLLDQALVRMGTHIAVKVVDARAGKRTRAEPVAALYERGLVRHVGMHEELEEQLVSWSGMGTEKSPDRLDALVWAMTDLIDSGWGTRRPDDGRVGIAVPYTTRRGTTDGAVPYDGEVLFPAPREDENVVLFDGGYAAGWRT